MFSFSALIIHEVNVTGDITDYELLSDAWSLDTCSLLLNQPKQTVSSMHEDGMFLFSALASCMKST